MIPKGAYIGMLVGPSCWWGIQHFITTRIFACFSTFLYLIQFFILRISATSNAYF